VGAGHGGAERAGVGAAARRPGRAGERRARFGAARLARRLVAPAPGDDAWRQDDDDVTAQRQPRAGRPAARRQRGAAAGRPGRGGQHGRTAGTVEQVGLALRGDRRRAGREHGAQRSPMLLPDQLIAWFSPVL